MSVCVVKSIIYGHVNASLCFWLLEVFISCDQFQRIVIQSVFLLFVEQLPHVFLSESFACFPKFG